MIVPYNRTELELSGEVRYLQQVRRFQLPRASSSSVPTPDWELPSGSAIHSPRLLRSRPHTQIAEREACSRTRGSVVNTTLVLEPNREVTFSCTSFIAANNVWIASQILFGAEQGTDHQGTVHSQGHSPYLWELLNGCWQDFLLQYCL